MVHLYRKYWIVHGYCYYVSLLEGTWRKHQTSLETIRNTSWNQKLVRHSPWIPLINKRWISVGGRRLDHNCYGIPIQQNLLCLSSFPTCNPKHTSFRWRVHWRIFGDMTRPSHAVPMATASGSSRRWFWSWRKCKVSCHPQHRRAVRGSCCAGRCVTTAAVFPQI